MTIQNLNRLLYATYKDGSWQIQIRFKNKSCMTIYSETIHNKKRGYGNLLNHIAFVLSEQKYMEDFDVSFPGSLYANILSIPLASLTTFMTTSEVKSDVTFYLNLDLQIISVFLRDTKAPEYSASFDKLHMDCFEYYMDFVNKIDSTSEEVKL